MPSRRIVHESARSGENRVLATDVELAESILSKARGLMFRRSIPERYALVMEMGTTLRGRPSRQGVHMLFVRFPLDVIWLVENDVQRVATLRPWRGMASARADRIIELPAGTADAVIPGDTVRVEEQ